MTSIQTIDSMRGETFVAQFASIHGTAIQITQDSGFVQFDLDDVGSLITALVTWRREQILSKFNTGMRVRYVPRHAYGDMKHQDCEDGTVSSRNTYSVFVKFDKQVQKLGFEGTTSQSCNPEDLHPL